MVEGQVEGGSEEADPYYGSTLTCGGRKHSGGRLDSPVVKWHLKGLTGNSQLGHVRNARKYVGGGLSSPAAERLNKGLTPALSSNTYRGPPTGEGGGEGGGVAYHCWVRPSLSSGC
eukprot:5250569-Pyramimonas_sp.AAC.1